MFSATTPQESELPCSFVQSLESRGTRLHCFPAGQRLRFCCSRSRSSRLSVDSERRALNRERIDARRSTVSPAQQPSDASYEQIGLGYSRARRTEPRIAARIFSALGDAQTVLNVGAGSGSYEPSDRDVLAVEPSRVMRSQRPPGAALCIDACAEALPFPNQSFDAALAVLSDHHWSDPIAGLREMRRVARRVVVFQWDDAESKRFWLVRDYLLPEYGTLTAGRPTLRERAAAIDARMEPVPIPFDVIDGFLHAYWRRPAAYLQEPVRRGCSVWTRVGEQAERRAVAALARDLDSGAWATRNAGLLDLESIDLGARLLIADGC